MSDSDRASFWRDLVPEDRPLLIGHRLGNSVPGLETGHAAGLDVVEADLHVRQGTLEVRHARTAGPLPILWDRWSIEAGWRPRLELPDLLAASDPPPQLMLDLKDRSLRTAPALIRAVQAAGSSTEVIVSSQNWQLLDQLRHEERLALVYSIGNRWQLRQFWGRITDPEITAVAIQFRLLDRVTAAALRRHVECLMAWRINDPIRLRRATRWGVNGVISDNVPLVRTCLPEPSPLQSSESA